MNIAPKKLIAGLAVAAVLGVIILLQLPSSEPRFNPSATPAYLPDSTDSFEYYIDENRRRIDSVLAEYYYRDNAAPFGPQYSQEQVLEMRSPFQLLPDPEHCEGSAINVEKGFLLVHGLTDSPYLLRSVSDSLAENYPCALIRGLLSPGHSTIPGDLLNVRLEQWYAMFEYGVDSFAGQVEQLYVVGYSNGSALALNYVDNNRDGNSVAGLILLSPGLETADTRSYLSPYLRYVMKWLNRRPDVDAVKYESFPTNAAAEFYRLTRRVTGSGFLPLDTPTLMVVSGDDTTINNRASADFFCQNLAAAAGSRLVWLQSPSTNNPFTPPCAGIEVREARTDIDRFISYSHVSMMVPVDDPHYGLDGNYATCLTYGAEPEIYRQCSTDHENTVYAEASYLDENSRYDGKLVRRTTFNPSYAEMIADIKCFVDANC